MWVNVKEKSSLHSFNFVFGTVFVSASTEFLEQTLAAETHLKPHSSQRVNDRDIGGPGGGRY